MLTNHEGYKALSRATVNVSHLWNSDQLNYLRKVVQFYCRKNNLQNILDIAKKFQIIQNIYYGLFLNGNIGFFFQYMFLLPCRIDLPSLSFLFLLLY